MKHFKIIETGGNYPNVLLYRDRNDDCDEVVKIVAFGISEEVENSMEMQEIVCNNYITACNFIEDFSVESAKRWCEYMNISYWNMESNIDF